jgi:hypothetical protein
MGVWTIYCAACGIAPFIYPAHNPANDTESILYNNFLGKLKKNKISTNWIKKVIVITKNGTITKIGSGTGDYGTVFIGNKEYDVYGHDNKNIESGIMMHTDCYKIIKKYNKEENIDLNLFELYSKVIQGGIPSKNKNYLSNTNRNKIYGNVIKHWGQDPEYINYNTKKLKIDLWYLSNPNGKNINSNKNKKRIFGIYNRLLLISKSKKSKKSKK